MQTNYVCSLLWNASKKGWTEGCIDEYVVKHLLLVKAISNGIMGIEQFSRFFIFWKFS